MCVAKQEQHSLCVHNISESKAARLPFQYNILMTQSEQMRSLYVYALRA